MAKTNKRPAAGRGLFYSRDSGGRHETTPSQYVQWAVQQAQNLGVRLNGTAEDIAELFKSGRPRIKDLFFDKDVSGNQMTRPALDALFAEIDQDPTVSHVFVPRRDRLARPDQAEDGLKLEKRTKDSGVVLVFQGQVVAARQPGRRESISDSILALVEYDASGKFRDDHAEKMIRAKISLAERGHATGGRPPFGFRRFLVSADGAVVRQLSDGERVRLAGHHVEWRPGPEDEVALIRRILELLETTPAIQVARLLTQEGIPAPDKGRTRHDNGIPHVVRGVWHATTIISIARNSLIHGSVEFGRRSMGDRRRFTADGPRLITHDDYRGDGKPKVVQNPEEARITAPTAFGRLISEEQSRKLESILEERAGSQRGKPRSRDPERNPLGARIFDLSCSWSMYRAAINGTYVYRCGPYQQSDGCQCRHNQVAGPEAVRFALAVVRQKLTDPTLRQKLQSRIDAKLRELEGGGASTGELDRLRAEKKAIQARLELIGRNMALAETDELRLAMQTTFREETAKFRSATDSEASLVSARGYEGGPRERRVGHGAISGPVQSNRGRSGGCLSNSDYVYSCRSTR